MWLYLTPLNQSGKEDAVVLNEIIAKNPEVPATVNGKIYEVLSEAVLKKAFEYIRKYDTETDAIIFQEGLVAIRDMCRQVESLDLKRTSYTFSLIKNELKQSINEVCRIVTKVHAEKPPRQLSDDDRRVISDIEQSLKNVFGITNSISLAKITPLLLEVKKFN